MENGRKKERGITSKLTDADMNTVLGTSDFGVAERALKQAVLDLKHYRYRVFDWLGMCLQGRCDTQHIERGEPIGRKDMWPGQPRCNKMGLKHIRERPS